MSNDAHFFTYTQNYFPTCTTKDFSLYCVHFPTYFKNFIRLYNTTLFEIISKIFLFIMPTFWHTPSLKYFWMANRLNTDIIQIYEIQGSYFNTWRRYSSVLLRRIIRTHKKRRRQRNSRELSAKQREEMWKMQNTLVKQHCDRIQSSRRILLNINKKHYTKSALCLVLGSQVC